MREMRDMRDMRDMMCPKPTPPWRGIFLIRSISVPECEMEMRMEIQMEIDSLNSLDSIDSPDSGPQKDNTRQDHG